MKNSNNKATISLLSLIDENKFPNIFESWFCVET